MFGPNKDRKFLDKMLKRHYQLLEHVVDHYTTQAFESKKPIHPELAASVLDKLADDDAYFTVDTGMCNVWGARYITPNGNTVDNVLANSCTFIGAVCFFVSSRIVLPRNSAHSASSTTGGAGPS
mgnify:CR=1 FL=1